MEIALGWLVGGVAGAAAHRLLRDAARGVRIGLPLVAVAAGIGGGLALWRALIGVGFGFAIGFMWSEARWRADRLTRSDGLR